MVKKKDDPKYSKDEIGMEYEYECDHCSKRKECVNGSCCDGDSSKESKPKTKQTSYRQEICFVLSRFLTVM